LDEVLGNDLTKPIKYGDLEKLHYCEAVIKEVTRHRPVAFTVGHLLCAEKDEVGGFTWPKGTVFTMFYYAMMKRNDYLKTLILIDFTKPMKVINIYLKSSMLIIHLPYLEVELESVLGENWQ